MTQSRRHAQKTLSVAQMCSYGCHGHGDTPVFESGMQYSGFARTRHVSVHSPASDRSGSGSGSGSGSFDALPKLYALPSDETEGNRDDMKHAMLLRLMGGRLFHAPVDDALARGGHVYDLGTGSGIWAIDVADAFPAATVRGVDLSPMQPDRVPPNVFFAVDDVEDPWPASIAPASLDFVHMRFALWAVDDPDALLRKIWYYLKPGGWAEFVDFVPTVRCRNRRAHDRPHALRDFVHLVHTSVCDSPVIAGADIADLPARLARAGFGRIAPTEYDCPIGKWGASRDLQWCGRLLQTAILDGLPGWAARPLGTTAGGLGWSPTQIEMFLVDVRKAVLDDTAEASIPIRVVCAQRP